MTVRFAAGEEIGLATRGTANPVREGPAFSARAHPPAALSWALLMLAGLLQACARDEVPVSRPATTANSAGRSTEPADLSPRVILADSSEPIVSPTARPTAPSSPTRSSFFPVGEPAAKQFHDLYAIKEPAPVALSREEAIARVLPWFLPEQAAHVQAVTFVSNWDFWVTIDRLAGETVDKGIDGMSIRTSQGHFGTELGGPSFVLAAVDVEAGPPRRPAPDLSLSPSWTSWSPGTPQARDSARRRLSYLFNATTGEYIGSPLLESAILDALRSKALAVVPPRPRPSPTATVDATATTAASLVTAVPTSPSGPGWPMGSCLPPDASPPEALLPDVVPAALADTLRWLPYVEGASWSYEWTIERSGVQWVRGNKRETVQGRWRIAPDAMLVRLAKASTLTLPALDEGGDGPLFSPEARAGTDWVVVMPGGSFALGSCKDAAPTLTERRAFLDASGMDSRDWPGGSREHEMLLAWNLVIRLEGIGGRRDLFPLAVGEETGLYEDGEADSPQVWQGTRGPIEGCRAFQTFGWRIESHAVFCPEVGLIALVDQSPASQGMFWLAGSDALVSYRFPSWHVIP